MFTLSKFCSEVPNRFTAGVFVCGKWSKEIMLHQKIISQIGHATYRRRIILLQQQAFQEKLYNLVKSWLMGRRTSLVTIQRFRTICQQMPQDALKNLSKITLSEYNSNIHRDSLEKVWNQACKIVRNKAKLVAVSKLLHHILPNLIVPIDVTYTNKFCHYCEDYPLESLTFRSFLGLERSINFFQKIVERTNHRLFIPPSGEYADTSDTKTIDNWIIMWVDLKMKDYV